MHVFQSFLGPDRLSADISSSDNNHRMYCFKIVVLFLIIVFRCWGNNVKQTTYIESIYIMANTSYSGSTGLDFRRAGQL
jgi:hypothetical protein